MKRTIIRTSIMLLTGASVIVGSCAYKGTDVQNTNNQTEIVATKAVHVNTDKIEGTAVVVGTKVELKTTSNEPELVVANTDDFVNVRQAATTESDVLGKFYSGSVATVIADDGEWIHITSGSVNGYVSSQYVLKGDEAKKYIEDKYSYVAKVSNDVSVLNVRADQSTDSDVIKATSAGETFEMVNQYDEWTEVKLSNGNTGYLSNEYVDVTMNYKTAISIEEEQQAIEAERARQAASNGTSGTKSTKTYAAPNTSAQGLQLGQNIASYALQFCGNPYVAGGTSLTNGTDCSGFTMSIYQQFGYSLPRTCGGQAGCGVEINPAEMQPGDLVFYHGFGHVGIYIGGGMIVHASTPAKGICTLSAYYSTINKVVRIVQ